MKKGLTMLVSVMIIVGMIYAICGTAAEEDMVIGREFTVKGVGIFSSDLDVSTHQHWDGLHLSERISTPGEAYNGLSQVEYCSDFELGMLNITGNSSMEMEYTSTSNILNGKRCMYMQNYVLGSVMGFKSYGDNKQEVSLYSEDLLVEAEIIGNLSGYLKLSQKVVDVRNTHNILIRDVIELNGKYTYDWRGFTENVTYPEAEECGDWLECP